MSHLQEELTEIREVVEVLLSEEELLEESRHKRREHWILLGRNLAVTAAVMLFAVSLLVQHGSPFKAGGYFCGAAAYFAELLLLTDCFSRRVAHRELFMVYCFGPMYVLLGISYLLGH